MDRHTLLNRWLQISTAFMALAASGGASATSCIVLGEPNSKARLNGEEIIELSHRNLPLAIEHCQTIEALSGRVELCKLDHPCQVLSPGDDPFMIHATDDGQGVWGRLVAILQGNTSLQPAGRLLEESREAPGFPSGELLAPAKGEALLISIDQTAFPNGISHFSLTEVARGRSIPTERGRQEVITVAGHQLRMGEEYQWQATTADGTYEGNFYLLDRESTKEVEERVRSLRGAIKRGSAADLLVRAAVYDEFDLQFDRDRMIQRYLANR